jgi:predicted transcriptional regulator
VEHDQPVGIVSLSDLTGEGDSHATLGDVGVASQTR